MEKIKRGEFEDVIIKATWRALNNLWHSEYINIAEGYKEFLENLRVEVTFIDYEKIEEEEALKILRSHTYGDLNTGQTRSGSKKAQLDCLRKAVLYFRDECNKERQCGFNSEKHYFARSGNELVIHSEQTASQFTRYGYFKNYDDCVECVRFFGKHILGLEQMYWEED